MKRPTRGTSCRTNSIANLVAAANQS